MGISQSHKEIICLLANRLKNMSEDWAITGSFGQALQGIDINPKDIDIISTLKGVLDIQSLLKEYIQQEVEYSIVSSLRSYFGVMEINTCRIEFFGEIENLLTNARWEPHINWSKNIIEIRIDNAIVPVIKLEYELAICKKLSNDDRVTLIEDRLLSL